MEFWFEYGSTYTYLTVMRIEDKAGQCGINVEWKPFLLMAVMKRMGWADTPFLQFPAKGNYMWRDLERRAEHHKLPYSRPSVYPPNTLLTARIGFLAFGKGWGQDFTREVFKRHWTEDKTIGTPDNLETVLEGLGKDPAQVTGAALSDQNKLALREQTDLAVQLGIFGSPSFVVGANRELFWGDDRLEEAFEWVKGDS